MHFIEDKNEFLCNQKRFSLFFWDFYWDKIMLFMPYPTIQGICCSFEIASVWDLRVGDRVSALFQQYSPIFTKKDISF